LPTGGKGTTPPAHRSSPTEWFGFGNGGRRIHHAWLPRGWDPDTGKKLWRRYTITGVRCARLETWPQNSDAWTRGGGPTWRSGSYDPQLDLVYWGTGNAEPYDPRPREGLDSLYTSSVLAIRPKTGELVCYYQYTPNDVYDTDGADENVLADMEIGGQTRKVMIQANKNGFHVCARSHQLQDRSLRTRSSRSTGPRTSTSPAADRS